MFFKSKKTLKRAPVMHLEEQSDSEVQRPALELTHSRSRTQRHKWRGLSKSTDLICQKGSHQMIYKTHTHNTQLASFQGHKNQCSEGKKICKCSVKIKEFSIIQQVLRTALHSSVKSTGRMDVQKATGQNDGPRLQSLANFTAHLQLNLC